MRREEINEIVEISDNVRFKVEQPDLKSMSDHYDHLFAQKKRVRRETSIRDVKVLN